MSLLQQAQIRRIVAKAEAILGSGGEKTVRFLGSQGDQIVNQHPDVGFRTRQDQRRFSLQIAGCVDSRHQSLSSCLFVPGGSVGLSGGKQSSDPFGLQRRIQLRRIDEIVLYGVAGAQDLKFFQPGHGMKEPLLDLFGQGRGDAVQVNLPGAQALGLNEDLVPFPVGETDYLIFDGGAVPRPDTFDLASVQRRAVQVFPDDSVRFRSCIGEVAGN